MKRTLPLCSCATSTKLALCCCPPAPPSCCPPDPPTESVSDGQAPGLCSHSVHDGAHPVSCYKCLVGSSPSHGVPGGMLCCGHTGNLAHCPRLWE